MTLINLGIFFQEDLPDREKSLECIAEALRIILPLQEKIPYLQKYAESAIVVVRNWGMDTDDFVRSLQDG